MLGEEQQQVFLPEHLENPPYVMYPNQKTKQVGDGKRRGGGVPSGAIGLGMRGSQVGDVLAGIRELNVSHRTDSSFPNPSIKFGAVAGVSLDTQGNVVIFHRADRVWTEKTFDFTQNTFLEKSLGAIRTSTILGINRRTGNLTYGFGRELFFMPHGITVDGDNNVWVTDVALHQVMKLNREVAGDNPLMVLGKKFTPGNNAECFCKPTSVAVLPNGDFFVADGYCNARIVKFNSVGVRILEWGRNAFSGKSRLNRNRLWEMNFVFTNYSFRSCVCSGACQLFCCTARTDVGPGQGTGVCCGPGEWPGAVLPSLEWHVPFAVL